MIFDWYDQQTSVKDSMKKIDFHIHTVSTDSDRAFVFSMDRLKECVEIREIACIAITNHNTFDLNQFKEINSTISITAFPAFELVD